jgi:hypothetical protein
MTATAAPVAIVDSLPTLSTTLSVKASVPFITLRANPNRLEFFFYPTFDVHFFLHLLFLLFLHLFFLYNLFLDPRSFCADSTAIFTRRLDFWWWISYGGWGGGGGSVTSLMS